MIGKKMFKKIAQKVVDSHKASAGKASAPSAPQAIGSPKRGRFSKVATAIASAAPKAKATGSKEEDVKNLMKNLPKLMRGRFKMFNEGGAVKKPVKRAAGSPPKGETTYEVLGRRVTKEQYDEASKEMDRPKSKVEEDMDDFAKQARERAKMKPVKRAGGSGPKGEEMAEAMGKASAPIPAGMAAAKIKRLQKALKEKYGPNMPRVSEKELKEMDELVPKMKTGGMAMKGKMADKVGRAMKKTAADAKGRAMTKAPKKMMGGGMAKYAKGGSVACGPATRGYGAARKGK